MKFTYVIATVFILFLTTALIPVLAEEDGDDITFLNFELESLINLGSGILALILFIVTTTAYQRTRNTKLKYVSIAFFLFAAKGLLTAHELFFNEWSLVDPIGPVLEFVALLLFFIGIMKK